MRQIFVIDTNVLLHDPNALYKFGNNDVVLPLTVIEEIDSFKTSQNETGRNARHINRILDKLREDNPLDEGVDLDNGGTITVQINDLYPKDPPKGLDMNKADNRILYVALKALKQCVWDEKKGECCPVILVTKDANLRIKANALGVPSQDYKNDHVDIDTLYTGMKDVLVDPARISVIYGEDASISAECTDEKFYPNECVTLMNASDPKNTALARYEASLNRFFRITEITKNNAPLDLVPRNREQRFAMDLLLDPEIKLVTLVGKAGTGKTLMAIAAGIYGATEDERGLFDRVLITRPVISLGKQDIGFLPGTMEEKMAPWMQPIDDNVDVLLGKADDKRDHKGSLDKESTVMSPADYLKKAGKLEVGALSYIRGRSIPRQFIVVDEAQNLTPHETKTIITRAGEGTKIVLTGDPYQIDNPYVDAGSNGLTYVAEKFKNERIAAHIVLTKGERSELAELAAELL